MTPEQRAALITDVAEVIIESMHQDAAPKPRQLHTVRCTVCGRTRQSGYVRQCRNCGGWMVYDDLPL